LSEQQKEAGVGNELPGSKNGKRKALIIGISKYDHNNKFKDLEFCENDANEVCNILKDQGYDIPENRLLVGRVEWLNMRDAIIEFFTDKRLKSDDTLFFYFSGHGHLDNDTGRTYLATSEIDPQRPERRALRFDDLTAFFNESNSERIVAVLDCCYSGALEIGGGGKGEEAAKSEKGEEIASLANVSMRKTAERLIKSGQGKCVLASSLEEKLSFKMEGQPYSTFTFFLTQGLRGANGECVDSNGYVTPELLGSYVNKKMEELPIVKQKPIRKIEVTGLLILAHHPDLEEGELQVFQRDYLLQLLKDGKINDFNEIRTKDKNHSRLDFYSVDLSGSSLRSINLKAAKLSKARLSGADFLEADLSGALLLDVDLSSANMSNANLSSTDLSKSNLSGAKLSGADLSSANMSNANLSGAKLSDTKLFLANLSSLDLSSTDLSGADLSSANLSSANLSGANLSFKDLSSANLSGANLSGANLSGANLSGADLVHAKLGKDLSNAKLPETNLSSANLSKTDMANANLSSLDLSSTDLSSANLSGANLSGANLSFKDLSNANMEKANLSRADLAHSKLSNANLSRANFEGANLSYADLSSKDLSASIDLSSIPWLSQSNLSGAWPLSTDLSQAKLSRANLEKANLSRANLSRANLSESKLPNANLSNANLSKANLENADLSSTDLTKADLTDAKLSKANLENSDLSSSIIRGWKFKNKNAKDYPLCKDVKFDSTTIIDNEELYRHFCNNNSNPDTIPRVVRGENEIRTKLEKIRQTVNSSWSILSGRGSLDDKK
jgi:uncharacterized protein YjbI with pentapeptide repeats